jgi:hypothetical protein
MVRRNLPLCWCSDTTRPREWPIEMAKIKRRVTNDRDSGGDEARVTATSCRAKGAIDDRYLPARDDDTDTGARVCRTGPALEHPLRGEHSSASPFAKPNQAGATAM